MANASQHGNIRIRNRCGVPKKAVKKIVDEAFNNGITHAETAGSLNRYITALYFYDQSANNIRIYGNKVFIFSGIILITVLNLPSKYKKTVDKIFKNRSAGKNKPLPYPVQVR